MGPGLVLTVGVQGGEMRRGIHSEWLRGTMGEEACPTERPSQACLPRNKGGLHQVSGVHTGFPIAGCLWSAWGLLWGEAHHTPHQPQLHSCLFCRVLDKVLFEARFLLLKKTNTLRAPASDIQELPCSPPQGQAGLCGQGPGLEAGMALGVG